MHYNHCLPNIKTWLQDLFPFIYKSISPTSVGLKSGIIKISWEWNEEALPKILENFPFGHVM